MGMSSRVGSTRNVNVRASGSPDRDKGADLGRHRLARKRIDLDRHLRAVSEPRVILLRYRHVDAKVAHGHELEHGRTRFHPLADLGHALGNNALIRRRQLVALEDRPAALLFRLETLKGSAVDLDFRLPGLHLVLRPVISLRETLGDAKAALGVVDLGGGLRGLRLGLGVGGLFQLGVEFQEKVALLHMRAAVEMDGAHQALHRGGDRRGMRRRHRAGQRASLRTTGASFTTSVSTGGMTWAWTDAPG